MAPSDSQPKSKFIDLGGTLRASVIRNPQKPAIICADRIVTYQDLDRSTDAVALCLLRHGLEPDDRVAIHWCNSVEVVTLLFACFKAGMIAVPLNNRLKAPEIACILQHSKAKLCLR
jgi:long-chain acyl-CoA synthetase